LHSDRYATREYSQVGWSMYVLPVFVFDSGDNNGFIELAQ